MFQFPVIYDTMTVGENLAFPLQEPRPAARPDRGACRARSRGCSTSRPILGRKANRLSVDAKQKISLGRGLVRADVGADPVRRAADGDRSRS